MWQLAKNTRIMWGLRNLEGKHRISTAENLFLWSKLCTLWFSQWEEAWELFALREPQLPSERNYFRKQECVTLGNEIPEVLFFLPVTFLLLPGLVSSCIAPHLGFQVLTGVISMLSLHQEMKAGEVIHYFVTDFIHDNPLPLLMWIIGTQLSLVNLTPVENFISFSQINLFLGVISWKLGPRWVHGTLPQSQDLAGWPQGCSVHLAQGKVTKKERSGPGLLCAGGADNHGQGWGCGCGWVSLVGQGCHQPVMDIPGMVGLAIPAGPRAWRGYAACVTWEAGWGLRHLVRIPHGWAVRWAGMPSNLADFFFGVAGRRRRGAGCHSLPVTVSSNISLLLSLKTSKKLY